MKYTVIASDGTTLGADTCRAAAAAAYGLLLSLGLPKPSVMVTSARSPTVELKLDDAHNFSALQKKIEGATT